MDNGPPADLAKLATKNNGSTALHIISTTKSYAAAKPHMDKFCKVKTTTATTVTASTTPVFREKPPKVGISSYE